ncbi:hypothetical protein B0H11DRAFT_2416079 [Mycena galericulata]|nr:hypothetical protein B0H11DRAFT_2416079 [Mycena galericulata]
MFNVASNLQPRAIELHCVLEEKERWTLPYGPAPAVKLRQKHPSIGVRRNFPKELRKILPALRSTSVQFPPVSAGFWGAHGHLTSSHNIRKSPINPLPPNTNEQYSAFCTGYCTHGGSVQVRTGFVASKSTKDSVPEPQNCLRLATVLITMSGSTPRRGDEDDMRYPLWMERGRSEMKVSWTESERKKVEEAVKTTLSPALPGNIKEEFSRTESERKKVEETAEATWSPALFVYPGDIVL